MALQSFTVSIGALRDVNNNDKNYVSGEAIYVKTIGGSFAPIFRDLAGTSEIAQDGLANQTNEKGQFTFFVEAGDYILEYQNQSTPVTIVGADYFNSRIEETVNQIIIDTSTSRGFRVVGAFSTGFTYELPNDVAIDGSGNYWAYADINALPVTVSAGTTPTEGEYSQRTWNSASAVLTNTGESVQDFIDVENSTRLDPNAGKYGVDISSGVDVSSQLTTALSGSSRLFIPDGEVRIHDVSPPTGARITGKNAVSTVIKHSAAVDNTPLFDIFGQQAFQLDNISLEGSSVYTSNNETGVKYDGGSNGRRGEFSQIIAKNFGGAAFNFSAGWGNSVDKTRINSCNYGIKFEESPKLAGWSGSGFSTTDSYIGGCRYGVDLFKIWNFTANNLVIENCTYPIVQGGSAGGPSVWVNTWTESNTNAPQLTGSHVFIGGRLEGGVQDGLGFFENYTPPIGSFSYNCITNIQQGIAVFRDINDPILKVDGNGVNSIKFASDFGFNFGTNEEGYRGLNIETGGSLHSSSAGLDADFRNITSMTGSRHIFGPYNEDMPQYGVHVRGQGVSNGSGRGLTKVVFSSGVYERDGSPATQGGDRWEVGISGHLTPLSDGVYDIGHTASNRVRDLRIVNSPIVGSDYRIKPVVESIPQDLLDFVMSVEIKQYKLHGGERFHYGIVITPDFLKELERVYSIDSCAALCQDLFTNDNGEPVVKRVYGKMSVISPVKNGGMLEYSVNTDEDFTLSLGDRIIVEKSGGIIKVDEDYSFSDNIVTTKDNSPETLPRPPAERPEKGSLESEIEFAKRVDDFDRSWLEYKESLNEDETKLTLIKGGVSLDEMWQVRYDEYQNILLEAMRRKMIN